jgi:hypothetical protein
LFFDCHFAQYIWSFSQVALNLTKTQSVAHMFGGWLNGVAKQLRSLVLLGAVVTCWSIWLHRNDTVFEKKKDLLSFAGYLCNFPHAQFVGYPSTAGVPRYGCGGITAIEASGEGYFYPGIWVVI